MVALYSNLACIYMTFKSLKSTVMYMKASDLHINRDLNRVNTLAFVEEVRNRHEYIMRFFSK